MHVKPINSPKEVGALGISQGAASCETGVWQQSAAPRSASSGNLEQLSQVLVVFLLLLPLWPVSSKGGGGKGVVSVRLL